VTEASRSAFTRRTTAIWCGRPHISAGPESHRSWVHHMTISILGSKDQSSVSSRSVAKTCNQHSGEETDAATSSVGAFRKDRELARRKEAATGVVEPQTSGQLVCKPASGLAASLIADTRESRPRIPLTSDSSVGSDRTGCSGSNGATRQGHTAVHQTCRSAKVFLLRGARSEPTY